MPEVRSTREVAEELGVQEWVIENALRRRELARPPLLGGMHLWDSQSVERLREALARRARAATGRRPADSADSDAAPVGASSGAGA